MDILALSMLNGLKRSGGVGYEEGFSITWDGNTEGRERISLDGEIFLYHVSDRVFTSAKELDGAIVTMEEANGNDVITAQIYENFMDTGVSNVTIVAGLLFGPEGAFVSGVAGTYTADGLTPILIPKSGTYFLYNDNSNRTKSLAKKTIHPISPKFLPGLCLPLVEFTTPMDIGCVLNAEDSAKLDAAGGSPIIGKFTLQIESDYPFDVQGVMYTFSYGDEFIYLIPILASVLAIASYGGQWMVVDLTEEI